MTNQDEWIACLLQSVERTAKYEERLAALEIVIEEIKHAQTPSEIDVLDRVAAAIKHRTTKEL
jgi:hypothetical protein